MRGRGSVSVYPAKDLLVEAAAERFLEIVRRAIEARGVCFIALAGGSTPRDLYARLAERSRREALRWEGVHLFWGDERAVPPDSPQSNYRMVRESLLDHIDLPAANVHRIRGELPAPRAAAEYAQVIQGTEPILRFDLALLGVGEDGHTASLFPGSPVLEERRESVAAVFVDKLQSWRITLTYPILNQSRKVIFLVSGASKADIMARISALEKPCKDYPASLVQPGKGRLYWMLDQQAARLVEGSRREMEE